MAQAKAGDISGAIQTADIIKNVSHKAVILEDIAVRLAEAGDIPRALQIAATIQNDFVKSRPLSAIATAQAKAGNKTGAAATFQQALQAANRIQDTFAQGRIAIALAEAGEVPKALELVSALPNDSWKADVLGGIAVAQTKSGDVTGAFKTIPMISKDYWQPKALRGVAVAQAEAGDAPGALKTVGMMQFNNIEKALTFSGIALAQARAGDYPSAITNFQQAIQTAAEDRYSKTHAIQYIVKDQIKAVAAQAEMGEVLGALEIAATIQDFSRKTLILEAIAVARAESGDTPRALQTAATLQSSLYKSRAFSAIAVAQSKAGDSTAAEATFQQALQAANVIQNHHVKAVAQGRIAIALAESRDMPKALELASTLPDNYLKADVLGGIAVVQTKAGDMTGALQTVAMIAKGHQRAKALREIAIAQAEAGDVPGAFKTVTMIRSDNDEKARAFGGIAAARAKAGDQTAARTTFQRAFRIAEGSRNKTLALHYIAVAQTNAGDQAAARDTLQKALKTPIVQDEVWKAAILKDIAVAQAKAGNVAGALKTAGRIPDVTAAPDQPRLKLSAMEGIAVAQVKAGDTQGAFQTAAIIQNNSEKALILRGITEAQARVGDLRGALQTADSIQDDLRKADALTGIAMAQLKSGDLRGSLLTTLIIQRGPRSALILRSVAKGYARSGAVQDDFVWFIDQCPPLLRSSALLGWAEGILEQTSTQKTQAALSSFSLRLSDVMYLDTEPAREESSFLQDPTYGRTEVQRTIQRESQKIKRPKSSQSDWQKLSDEQIARLFFPKGKLGFGDSTEGLVDEDRSIDGTLVYEVKRVIANFDNDPEDEMAVLIVYSTQLAYAEYTEAIFAILGIENGEIKIRWRTEEGEAFANALLDLSAIRLIDKDKFSALAYIYDSSHAGMGSSYQEMKIIRWDGKKFSEIWNYPTQSYDSGGRGGTPHGYLAKVDFVDGKNAKRIKVNGMYATPPYDPELRTQKHFLYEEFAWNDKAQRYLAVRQHKFADLVELLEELNAPQNLIDDLKEAQQGGLEGIPGY